MLLGLLWVLALNGGNLIILQFSISQDNMNYFADVFPCNTYYVKCHGLEQMGKSCFCISLQTHAEMMVMSNAMYHISICSSPVAFITIFVTLFALVIAITKDLPDVEGDLK